MERRARKGRTGYTICRAWIIKPDLPGNSRQRAFGKTCQHRKACEKAPRADERETNWCPPSTTIAQSASANICGRRARQKLSAAKLKLCRNAAIAAAHAHHFWTRNLLRVGFESHEARAIRRTRSMTEAA